MSNITQALYSDRLKITHTVGADWNGLRLDSFLKDRIKRSREHIKKKIHEGAIQVIRDQSPHLKTGRLKPSSQLLTGDEVCIMIARGAEPNVSFDYSVLYEDDALLIINKPANLPVHPAGAYLFNTLLTYLRTDGFKNSLRAEKDYFLAHRIDKETSGILVMTKTPEDCAQITEQFAARTTQKTYLAVVKGIPKKNFAVDMGMIRSKTSVIRLKMETLPVKDGGIWAQTDFTRLKTTGAYSLIECHPKTGRQHQIRVHLAYAGFPIVGDKLYSLTDSEAIRFYPDRHKSIKNGYAPIHVTPELEAKLVLPRQALHAARLIFKHPRTQKEMTIEAPLPADLESLISTSF